MGSNINNLNFKWAGEFVIGIAQDYKTKDVLMCAFMNRDAVQKTLETGYAHYYSTTRKKLWKKGEESGNTQKIIKIIPDCDNDTLLMLVEQKGVACHTGNKTCFYRENIFKK
jgi:phosphoribosyl-AMP cyclohydrolase